MTARHGSTRLAQSDTSKEVNPGTNLTQLISTSAFNKMSSYPGFPPPILWPSKAFLEHLLIVPGLCSLGPLWVFSLSMLLDTCHSGGCITRIAAQMTFETSSSWLHVFFKHYLFLFYVCGCFACIYVWTLHMCTAHRNQTRALESLKLELWATEGCELLPGARNQIQVPWKNRGCF